MYTQTHRLDPGVCIRYYSQQGYGNNVYASNYPIQRGFGLFSNLGRFVIPLLKQAGVYLGKNLLSTGQNVLQDVSEGKNIADSARIRFRESGKKIKDDVLQRIQSGRGRIIKRKVLSRIKQSKRRKLNKKDVFSSS